MTRSTIFVQTFDLIVICIVDTNFIVDTGSTPKSDARVSYDTNYNTGMTEANIFGCQVCRLVMHELQDMLKGDRTKVKYCLSRFECWWATLIVLDYWYGHVYEWHNAQQ